MSFQIYAISSYGQYPVPLMTHVTCTYHILTTISSCEKYLHQGVTSSWKSVHWISGYQDIKDIRGIIKKRYQEKIDQSSIEYLTGFSRILKKYLLDISTY